MSVIEANCLRKDHNKGIIIRAACTCQSNRHGLKDNINGHKHEKKRDIYIIVYVKV